MRSVTAMMFACTVLATLPAQAQNWPSKPIRWIIPYPPGGGAEVITRLVANKLTESLGQPVYLDFRPGAGGIIGTDLGAKSAPDGYTMVHGTIGPIAINPSLYSKMPFDPAKDLLPVTQLVNVVNVLVVHSALPVKSMKDLLALAKARPGQLNWGSVGQGSEGHLAGELLNTMAGVKLVHVPYKGGAPAMLDLMAGNIQLIFATVSTSLGQIKSGKIRPIAIAGATRYSMMPDLPTIAEAGIPGYAVNNWYGLFVPAGTPKEIVMRLNAETVKALNAPEVKQRLLEAGLETAPSTPEEFSAYIQTETSKWAKVIKDAGIKLD